MQIEASHTYHALYVSVHKAHKEASHIWTDHECNRILTAVMAAKAFSWRVVGITPAALNKFAEFNFRYKSRHGITRAHIKPRIETVRELLEPIAAVSEGHFFDIWLQNDKTVLCALGENKQALPQFIEIDNDDGKLFSCTGKLAGWRHGAKERDFLQNLSSSLTAR